MSGYSLENRYFFVPGFPAMAHPMIESVIKRDFCYTIKKYRKTFLAQTSEETLTTLMQMLPQSIELSSLPMFVKNRPNVELSLSGTDLEEVEKYFSFFIEELQKNSIQYQLI
jgi:molybdopterin-biosynthesis enzyme MoeA-like protein